jgi:hypothetical protein
LAHASIAVRPEHLCQLLSFRLEDQEAWKDLVAERCPKLRSYRLAGWTKKALRPINARRVLLRPAPRFCEYFERLQESLSGNTSGCARLFCFFQQSIALAEIGVVDQSLFPLQVADGCSLAGDLLAFQSRGDADHHANEAAPLGQGFHRYSRDPSQ